VRILGPKDASVTFHFKIRTVQIMLLNSSNRSCLHMELFLQIMSGSSLLQKKSVFDAVLKSFSL